MAATPPALTLDVKRFTDAGVLATVADRAVATTLVTTEGRALTEIKLHLQNRAQPGNDGARLTTGSNGRMRETRSRRRLR